MSQINLGQLARDTITGFMGVVVSEHKWLHGCRRISLQPRALKDGRPIAEETFDDIRCELVPAPAEPSTDFTGGDRPAVRQPTPPKQI